MTLPSYFRSNPKPRSSALLDAIRRVRRVGGGLLAILLASTVFGCAFGEIRPHDILQREYSLEEMQKRYTDLVRFSNFSMAARYHLPENRKAFLDGMPREDQLRFLDYESDPFVLNEAMTESTVEVVYTAYSPWNLNQIELYETQKWTRKEGVGNDWKVESTFYGLEPFVTKRIRPSKGGVESAAGKAAN